MSEKSNPEIWLTTSLGKSGNFGLDFPLCFHKRGILEGEPLRLDYYRKMVEQHPASILLRARGEVLEEKDIKESKGAMFAYLVKKHTGASGLMPEHNSRHSEKDAVR